MVNYPLVMTFTVRHGFSMALIEIDGLPINSMVIFHGEMLVITRWYRETPPKASSKNTRQIFADLYQHCIGNFSGQIASVCHK